MRNIAEEINLYKHHDSLYTFVDKKDSSRNKRLTKQATFVMSLPNKITSFKIGDISQYSKGKTFNCTVDNFPCCIDTHHIIHVIGNATIINGIVQDECVWHNNSGLGPVVLYSPTYNKLSEKDKTVKSGSINQVPGGIYEDINGAKHLYLGRFNGIDIKSKYVATPYNKGYHTGHTYVYTAYKVTKYYYIRHASDFTPTGTAYIEGFKNKIPMYKYVGMTDATAFLKEEDRIRSLNKNGYYRPYNLGNTELTPEMIKRYPGITWGS